MAAVEVAVVEVAAVAAEETDSMENICGNDRSIVLQWHLTSRCNLRCKHCYQSDYQTPELDFEYILAIMKQYIELLSKLKRRGHINFTGGEPFLREDFLKILHECKKHASLFNFGVLTNGTLLTEDIVKELGKLGPDFIQVSIEGDEEIHDSIRGRGNLKDVLNALNILTRYGIKTLVSFTAHRGNYKSFPNVVDLCRKHRVFKVWTDRIVPFGTGEALKEQALSPEEVWEFFNIIDKTRKQKNLPWRRKIIVEMRRSLQFLVAKNEPYRCGAGESLITLLEDGTVLPCRRMPIECGNVKDNTLLEIYSKNNIMVGLREKRKPPAGCERCSYYFLCNGGAKCISYAMTGDPFSRDPGCPIIW